MSDTLQLDMSSSRSRSWWLAGAAILACGVTVVAVWKAAGPGPAPSKTSGLNSPPQNPGVKPADGTGLASLQGDGSTGPLKASSPKPGVGDPEKLAELQKTEAALKEKLKGTLRDYNAELEKFLSTRPDLAQWHHMATLYEMEYHRLERQQADFELRHYFHSPDQGPDGKTGLAGEEARNKEVGQVRRFLLLQELSSLLGDAQSGPAVSSWLEERLRTLNSPDGPLPNSSSASNWRVIGDALFPDAASIRTLLTSADRAAFVNAYTAQNGLGTVDESLAPGMENYLRQLLHTNILMDSANHMVTSGLPAPLLKMSRDIDDMRKQTFSFSRQVDALNQFKTPHQ